MASAEKALTVCASSVFWEILEFLPCGGGPGIQEFGVAVSRV